MADEDPSEWRLITIFRDLFCCYERSGLDVFHCEKHGCFLRLPLDMTLNGL